MRGPRPAVRGLLLGVALTAGAAAGLTGAARAEDPPARITLRPADRKAIVELTKQFLMTAVVRRNLDVSYDLVTTKMKDGMSRAEWRKGNLPVIPVPARGSLAATWIYRQVGDRTIYLVYILTPPSGVPGLYLPFDLEAKKVGQRWLVNYATLHMGWPPVPAGGWIRIPFLETHDLGGRPIPPAHRTVPVPPEEDSWDDWDDGDGWDGAPAG